MFDAQIYQGPPTRLEFQVEPEKRHFDVEPKMLIEHDIEFLYNKLNFKKHHTTPCYFMSAIS